MDAAIMDRRRRVIRTDGSIELLDTPVSIADCERLLNTDALDTVNLRHMGPPAMVMLVIDRGWHTVDVTEQREFHGELVEVTTKHPVAPMFPINEAATALYHANCRPGTTQRIAGDVVIAPDTDFATGEEVFQQPAPACVQCSRPFKFGPPEDPQANVFTEAGQRETAITGLCEACWDELFEDAEEVGEDTNG